MHHHEIFRITGDEFTALCRDGTYLIQLKEKFTQIIKDLEVSRFIIGNDNISINFTCGIASGKSHDVYRLAHIALREARERHQKVIYFNENMHLEKKIKNNIEITEKIKSAIKNNRIIPFFQGIVESEGIENFEDVILVIAEIKQYGCKIAIDDFGSGYSNFSYLEALKVDFIKIDGSLIKNIDKDDNKKAIIKSILLFAEYKGIKTIAEFVENEAEFKELVKLGVDFSQGYLFSKPSRSVLPIS